MKNEEMPAESPPASKAESYMADKAESMRQSSAVGISSFFIYISHYSLLITHLTMGL